MRLFNVDQEHWEEVVTQDIAPSSALAYARIEGEWKVVHSHFSYVKGQLNAPAK